MNTIRPSVSVAAILLVATACGTAASPSPTATETTAARSEAPATEAWARTAAEHRGMDGEQFTYECPAGGDLRTVWGSDVYTDDSSVCTAGVHAGAISVDEGGSVTIEVRPGEEAYVASERNGVATLEYGEWGGSFVVVTN